MSDIKTIAYYLTQFHQIPENDEWWGEGFTEWTNVKKAKPLFQGHDQPRVPYKYYDLSNERVMIEQIAMAKKYRLYGFCFYYYWFSGKRLLEKPLERLLVNKTKAADFPFMICWANENWSRTWDGSEKEILINHDYSFEDDKEHFKKLLHYFQDNRYIKIKGKPVFVIYRANLFPDIKKTGEIWNNLALEAGLPGIISF